MYRPDEQLAAGLPDGDYTAYRILHHVLPEMYSELQVWLDMSPRRRGYIREGLARMIALVHPTYQRVLPLRTGWPAEVINNIDTRSNTGASWINFMEGQFSLPPAFAPTDTYPQRCRLLGAEDQAFREAIVSVLRPHAARVHQSCTKLVRGVAGLGAWLNFCEASPVESVVCVTAEQHISRWASAVSALDKAVHTVAMGEHRLGKAKANRALYQREFKQVMKDKGVTEGAVRVNSKAGMMEFDVVPVWLDPYRGYVPSGQRGILKSIVPMQRGAYHRVFLKIIDYREVTLNGYPTKVPVYTSDQDAHDAHGKVWNADIDQREQPKLMRQARRQLPAAKRNERVARDELESFLAPFR
jgi:hypothetical protein